MTWLAAWLTTASAVTLTLSSETTPWPGVTVQTYRTSSPDTDTHVVQVDLCAAGVHVETTTAPDGLQSVPDWAEDAGVQIALNGDFYTTSPTQVYGHAVGQGIPWPLDQTGRDPAYSSEWYADKYGYMAFGHDWVDFTHTEQVKNEAATWGLVEGWALTDIAPAERPGTLSLVSGFPELVVEGQPVVCSSPTDPDCFPDRSDMRSRHPRSAVGLTADRSTLLLVAVDGRTSTSDGMYGSELADVMAQLDAHVAFNLDGGGSTQLWMEGDGLLNDASGNNYGGGARAVANHLGVHVGGTPTRPGHCETEPACATLDASGGILDDDSSCFRTFGNPVYWREEAAGHGGRLFWTNAWDTDLPENWAWWQLELEEAGEYLVEYWAEPDYAVFAATHYEVLADGVTHELVVDQAGAGGWQPLGTFAFATGGAQHVSVYDDYPGSVAADSHVVADALRLTRVDAFCGDGVCDGDEDCSTCPDDCPPSGEEVPGNLEDDDCDGWVDERPEPDTGWAEPPIDSGLPPTDTETEPSTDPTLDTAIGSDTATVEDDYTSLQGCATSARPAGAHVLLRRRR